ncbi:MAG: 3-phosphoshikimate 1-carboxyvinyltransferase [Spirochaetales bacterium]|nr:3-phosphoshikimate 1-carboxyvinyltransferase [Spirochaetales bacterium]
MDSPPELFLPRQISFRGSVQLPGSKSIANRALLLSALAQGDTLLFHLPDADDTRVLLQALTVLGIEWSREGDALCVRGCAGELPRREAFLDLENAGTAFRPLVAILAFAGGYYTLTGNEQMQRRPVGDLTRALSAAGLGCSARDGNFPPVAIDSPGAGSRKFAVKGEVSSQFISALLMASVLASGTIEIRTVGPVVSKPYIELTISMLADFGVRVERQGYELFRIEPGQLRSPGSYRVEGDATAATYFLGLGAFPGSGPIRIGGLRPDSAQGDLSFTKVIGEMGGRCAFEDDWLVVHSQKPFAPLDMDFNSMPDAAMTAAVLSAFAEGRSHLRGLANLELKESRRLTNLATELNRLGVPARAGVDDLTIDGGGALHSARIETYRDHRMAMAFSLASYGTDLTILDPGCVSKTFPDYFSVFRSLLA